MKALKVLKYVGIAILGIGFCLLVIWGVQALWNSLVPNLFHGPVLSYWQTAGLFLLSKILLTGVAPGSHSHNSGREWKRKYHEKYRNECIREGEAPAAGATV
jgi:hypothetical protein